MIKSIIVAVALLAASTSAYASEPFHFGIALCDYSWSERTDSLLVGTKMNPAVPDDVWQREMKHCNSKENVAAAMQAHAKYMTSVSAQPAPLPPEGVNMDEANDTYRACVLGASDDGQGYLRLVSSYGGNARMLSALRKAHSYGYNVARTYRACTNYVMGR